MGLGALRRHYHLRQNTPTPEAPKPATPSTESVPPTNVTSSLLADLRKDPKFEAAYQEELRLAEEAEKGKQ